MNILSQVPRRPKSKSSIGLKAMYKSSVVLKRVATCRSLATSSRASSATLSTRKLPNENQHVYQENVGTLNMRVVLGVAGISLCTGYTIGKFTKNPREESHPDRVLPSGMPRACCSCDAPPVELSLTQEQENLPSKLAKIVGKDNVISGMVENSNNINYLKGARLGKGKALAIVQPECITDAVKALEAVVEADAVVIPQGQNTGLTGGSVPRDDDGRPTVVINMRKLNTMFPIDDGKRVVCLAGSGIATLAKNLSDWGFHDRESHSTLGSTFLDPTTAGK